MDEDSTMQMPSGRMALPTGPRRIRAIAPPQAPWPGALVHDRDGRTALLVAAGELAAGWAWRAAAVGHIAAPIDLVRTRDGHDVVMPLCTERVDGFLRRRHEADLPLSPGELVTLVVSVLRGTAEAIAAAAPGERTGVWAGVWWLTDGGRPLLVADGSGEADAAPVLDAATALVGEVQPDADDSRLRAAIDRAAELLAEPRALDRGVPEVERQLFAAAAPAPLATTAFAPMRARRAAAGRADPAPAVPSAASTRWWEQMLPHVDRGLGEMVSDAATSVWRRLRADRPGRRRHPVLLASGVAAGVLAVGLLWPEPGPSSAVAEGTTTAATAHATESGSAARPTPVPSTREKTAAPVDALTAVTALLDARAGCADAACRARSQEDPAAVFPDGAAARAPDERTVSLVDDYGGAAVLRVRVKDGPGPDQLIVAVRTDGEWLLRDVRAVAEQP